MPGRKSPQLADITRDKRTCLASGFYDVKSDATQSGKHRAEGGDGGRGMVPTFWSRGLADWLREEGLRVMPGNIKQAKSGATGPSFADFPGLGSNRWHVE